MKDLRGFIKTTIREFLNEQKTKQEEKIKNVFIDGLYDPEYEENGLVLFKEPKNINDYKNVDIYPSDLINGREFVEKYVDFSNKKLHKVIYKPKINIGSNLGKGEYWCATEYCLDVYMGNTPDSSDYSEYVDSIISLNLSEDSVILVKNGISDYL